LPTSDGYVHKADTLAELAKKVMDIRIRRCP